MSIGKSEINKKRLEALKVLQSQLEDFVNEYMCPHDTLIVTQVGAEVVSGECFQPFVLRD